MQQVMCFPSKCELIVTFVCKETSAVSILKILVLQYKILVLRYRILVLRYKI
jgi:hypothetical protein